MALWLPEDTEVTALVMFDWGCFFLYSFWSVSKVYSVKLLSFTAFKGRTGDLLRIVFLPEPLLLKISLNEKHINSCHIISTSN